MQDIVSRHYFKKCDGLFDKELIATLYKMIHISSGSKTKASSEREALVAKQGAQPNALRLDPTWFKLFTIEVDRFRKILDPLLWIVYPPQIRVMQEESLPVPWHQDAGYQRASPSKNHNQVATIFLPLDPNPYERATLQFSFNNQEELDHKRTDHFDAVLDGSDFSNLKHYNLNTGDALLFGDLVLHQTHTPTGCKLARTTFEFRAITEDSAIQGKDYFDITKLEFVRTEGESPVNKLYNNIEL